MRRAAAIALVVAAAAVSAEAARADGGGRATGLAPAAGTVWTTVPGGIVPLNPHSGRLAAGATATGRLGELTSGDGRLWGLRPWTLIRIDLPAHAVREFHVHGPAYAFAAGFGSVWIASGEGTLTRVDARSGRTVATIGGIGQEAESVAVGFGSVWVSSVGPWRKGPGGVMMPRGRGSVTRVDPGRNAVAARIPVGRGASAIAAGEGSIWVANSRGIRPDDTVSRIDPAKNEVAATIRVPRSEWPPAIAAGAGAAWMVASPGGGGVLTRIDSSTNHARTTRLRPSWTPGSVLVAAGRVWVADEGTATVLRLDPRSLRSTVTRIGLPPALPRPRIEPPAVGRSRADGVDWVVVAIAGGAIAAALALVGAALLRHRVRTA